MFDYQVTQHVAQPGPQFSRFFVLQDRPTFVLYWRASSFVERGTIPNGTSSNVLLATVPEANVNRVIVDAGGTTVHEVNLGLTYRSLKSLDLNVLVVSIPRFNACFPSTVELPPAFTRVDGTPNEP